MAKKIELKNNYFVITDTDTSIKDFKRPVKDISFDVNLNNKIQFFYRTTSIGNLYTYTDFVDDLDSDFSSLSDLEDYLEEKTSDQTNPTLTIPKRTAYTWNLANSWLSTSYTTMFSNVPIGTYELRLHFATENSTLHSRCDITTPNENFGFGYGFDTDVEGYIEKVLYFTTTFIGDFKIKANIVPGPGGVLRPSATMISL